MHRLCALILVSLAVALAPTQALKARWGVPLDIIGNETLIARPGGGVLLTSGLSPAKEIRAFSANGALDWTLPGVDTNSVWGKAPDGSLLLLDVIQQPQTTLRLRKYDGAGQLVDTKTFQVATGAYYGQYPGIDSNGQGTVIFANLAATGQCVFFRLDENLNVVFSKSIGEDFYSVGGAQITEDGCVYASTSSGSGSALVKKFTPGGTAIWEKRLDSGAGMLVSISGGRAFGGYSWSNGGSSGVSGRILDANGDETFIGSGLGSQVLRENGMFFLFSGFDGVTLRASMTRFLYTGALSWTLDFGFNGTARVDGTDIWGHSYAMTTSQSGGKRLYKVNPYGKVLWYRNGGVDSAVSPFNQDIFLVDKLSNRIRLYCFQQAPIGYADVYSTANTTPLNVNVASNDRYAIDATFSIVTPPSSGSASITPDGILTYTPASGFVGMATLRYRAQKAGLTPSADVLVTINVTG